jgi:hypothetical protein
MNPALHISKTIVNSTSTDESTMTVRKGGKTMKISICAIAKWENDYI